VKLDERKLQTRNLKFQTERTAEVAKTESSLLGLLRHLRLIPSNLKFQTSGLKFPFVGFRNSLKPVIPRRTVKILGAAALLLLLTVTILDCFLPPLPGRHSPYAVTVVARDGTPLRAFAGDDHVWRYPVSLNEVSPLYLDALVAYEDRAFRWHPGVNPIALVRAGWQWMRHGHIVSGGSTITMQVARILQPTRRSLAGKLIQIARALQIERRYSKNEILTIYINYAPMGGVLEGVEAASRGYLGKPSSRLTHAEAALLTVLPQSPSRLRPDRFPDRSQLARDKVLRRMNGRWADPAIADALTEPVYAQTVRVPVLAPLRRNE